MSTKWTRFLHKNKNKGYSLRQLSSLYKKSSSKKGGIDERQQKLIEIQNNINKYADEIIKLANQIQTTPPGNPMVDLAKTGIWKVNMAIAPEIMLPLEFSKILL